MNQNSEVVAGHTEITADIIFAALVKEQGLQQAAIFFPESSENLANRFLHLAPGDGIGDRNSWIRNGIYDFCFYRHLPAP